tara:strand:- start:146 stop:676 length:531 start_codon:yes stop_codon:yes gene_type:complete
MSKIIVSVILTLVLIIGINKLSDVVYFVEKPEKAAYVVNGTSGETLVKTVSSESEGLQPGDIKTLLALGSVENGVKVFKKCAACHSIAKDGKNKIGPALWGVIGRKTGSISDYKYSKALLAYEKEWSFEEMNGFLIKPKDWIKGTKMAYAGLKKEEERASVILYLNSMSDNPLPTP